MVKCLCKRALILSLWNPKNNHESAINDIKYAYEYGRILHRAGYISQIMY